MNKRGFTLIEIIICLVLIVGIGSISLISVLNNNNDDNKIKELTRKIVDAANVYISVEKDGNGNTYQNGILKGGKGIYISLETLEDKGYLDSSIVSDLKRETQKEIKDLMLLAVNAVNNENSELCKNNLISFNASWISDNDGKYLCPYSKTEGTSKSILSSMLENNEIRLNIPDLDNYQDSDKGLYILMDDVANSIYYYGKVDNNYIKFNDELWRIIRLNGDGTLKIILDDIIDVELEKGNLVFGRYYDDHSINSTGEYINISNELKEIACYDIVNASTKCFYNHSKTNSQVLGGIDHLNDDVIPIVSSSLKYNFFDSIYNGDGTYFYYIKEWYQKLNNKNYIQNSYNFCNNGDDYSYAKKDFTCEDGTKYGKYYSNSVGTISYKELKYSGGVNSYLTDIDKNFYTADFSSSYSIYYYNFNENTIRTQNLGSMTYGSGSQRSLYTYDSTPDDRNIDGTYIGNYNTVWTGTIHGLRPVVNLKSNLCYTGDGTNSNPYEITECN